MMLKLVLVVNLGCYVSFQCLFTFHDNFSGLFIIWRWGVFVHFPRSLCGRYALSLQWSLVKACGYYVPLCKYTYPCLCFIFFFFSMFLLGFSCIPIGYLLIYLCVYVCAGMWKSIWILLLLSGHCLTVCRRSGQAFRFSAYFHSVFRVIWRCHMNYWNFCDLE